MSEWSISRLLSGLHDDISRRLATVRETLAHPGTKGDASERVWLELLQKYLPKRYQAEKAHVVDSLGIFSEQIDVVIFDRQYSPFIFNFEESLVIPAESVYAIFEAKRTINAQLVKYAGEKVANVRRLHRTGLPIPHVGGTYPPKLVPYLLGGLLTFESEWSPLLGEPLLEALQRQMHMRACLRRPRPNWGNSSSHATKAFCPGRCVQSLLPRQPPSSPIW